VVDDAGDYDDDPRAALVRRLLEYERIKSAALRIDTLPVAERDFAWVEVWIDRMAVERLPEVRPEDLLEAWRYMIRRAKLNTHHRVTKEGLSVRERMTAVLKRLGRDAYTPFIELFDPAGGAPELVVTFLAILELAKEGLVAISQGDPYQPIYARLA